VESPLPLSAGSAKHTLSSDSGLMHTTVGLRAYFASGYRLCDATKRHSASLLPLCPHYLCLRYMPEARDGVRFRVMATQLTSSWFKECFTLIYSYGYSYLKMRPR